MITIREITAEEAAIESEWAKDMPLWWQATDRSVSRRTHGPKTTLGVFTDELVIVYTLQEVGPKIIDSHLSCRRGVEPEVIIESAKAVKRKLLSEGYTSLFLWPLRANFALIKIAKLCGFKPTGVRMLMGELRGRPAEWIQLGASNE